MLCAVFVVSMLGKDSRVSSLESEFEFRKVEFESEFEHRVSVRVVEEVAMIQQADCFHDPEESTDPAAWIP